MQRSRGAEEQGCEGAEEQGSRGAEEQGSERAEEQGSRGAEEQRSRGAEELGSRGAEEQKSKGARVQRSRGEKEMEVGDEKKKPLQSHRELEVYQLAFDAAMRIFELTKSFPKEERYSLTDQIRRASRSVCSNIAEAWRKRRYEAAFVSKLNDSEAEAAETQTWLEFPVKCGYLDSEVGSELHKTYDWIIGKLVDMIASPRPWPMKSRG